MNKILIYLLYFIATFLSYSEEAKSSLLVLGLQNGTLQIELTADGKIQKIFIKTKENIYEVPKSEYVSLGKFTLEGFRVMICNDPFNKKLGERGTIAVMLLRGDEKELNSIYAKEAFQARERVYFIFNNYKYIRRDRIVPIEYSTQWDYFEKAVNQIEVKDPITTTRDPLDDDFFYPKMLTE